MTPCFFVQQIDIPEERIFVAVSKSNLKPEEVGALTPPNTGSYHLYRFTHEFDGSQQDPTGASICNFSGDCVFRFFTLSSHK